MRLHSEIPMPEGFVENELIRAALVAAYWGEYERALAAVTSFLSEDPPEEHAVFALREAVPWRVAIGEVERAVRDAENCVAKAVELWGDLDPRTLVIRNTQMYWLGKVGKQRQAQQAAESLLADAELTLGRTDSLSLAIRNNVARIVELGDAPEQAERLYLGLLQDFEAVGEAEGECALTTRDNYAQFLEDNERFVEAREVMRRQVLLLVRAFGRKSEQVLAARFRIAQLTLALEEIEQAIALLEELATDCVDHLDVSDSLITDVHQLLLALAVSMDRPDEVVRNCDKMLGQLVYIMDPAAEAVLELKKLRNHYLERCATAPL